MGKMLKEEGILPQKFQKKPTSGRVNFDRGGSRWKLAGALGGDVTAEIYYFLDSPDPAEERAWTLVVTRTQQNISAEKCLRAEDIS